MKTLRKSQATLLVIGLSISMIPLSAQIPGTTGKLLLAMAANAKRVTQYEWKQRITVVRKGKPAEPVIDQVRFDSSGKLQRTTISAPPAMSGIRGRIQAGVKENVQEIMELAGRYNKPQQMLEFIKKAQVTQTSSGPGFLRLQANDLIKPGDATTMLVDPRTHLAAHVDIKTDYDGGPMTVAQDYGPIPGGPNMMKSMNVSVPHKDLTIKVESYDFAQQSARISTIAPKRALGYEAGSRYWPWHPLSAAPWTGSSLQLRSRCRFCEI
jgi:hypothetical protein